jgi:hypothetical protein
VFNVADLPADALREAAAAYSCAYTSGVPHEELARVAVEAAAPILAAHERVVVSGEFERPKYERGGFLNDARWAARIARQAGEARDPR